MTGVAMAARGWGRRGFDALFAAAVLLVLSPLLALCAVAVLVFDGRPVIFRQERVGQWRRLFAIMKFRTMTPGSGGLITHAGDPRVTRIGRMLRAYKLDELPQFWNVLAGEMSMVGPRPEVPAYVAAHERAYRRVLAVRPGMTDWSSVIFRDEEAILAAHRAEPDFYERVLLPRKLALARLYLRRSSLVLNAGIVLATACLVVGLDALALALIGPALVWRARAGLGLSSPRGDGGEARISRPPAPERAGTTSSGGNVTETWPRTTEKLPTDEGGNEVLNRLWAGRRAIFGGAVAAAVLALAASFVLPRAYTASASFVPEQTQRTNLPAGLAGLAGQFGFASGSGGSQSPEFYARLLSTRALRAALVASPIAGRTLIEYYGVGGHPDSVDRAVRRLAADYSVSVDRITQVVRLDVELRTPALAAAVAQRFLSAVDQFNSDIRRTLAGERRRFIENRVREAGEQLQGAENRLRDFLVANRSQEFSPRLQFDRGRLERRVTVAQDLYLSLQRDLQQASIDEVNDTPVISVIDPPVLPYRPSRPNRPVMVLMAAFLGGALFAGAVLWRPQWWPGLGR